MPWHDWQFWLVTVLAVWGLWMLSRPFWPRRKADGSASASCPNCSSGRAAAKSRKVALTIEKRRV